jgi:hypothetical protein
MLADWQTWLAAILCLAAAAYVARRAWLSIAGKKSAGCGSGCSSCKADAPIDQPIQLISIERKPPAGERKI